MNSIKTTKKEILERNLTFKVGYCRLQYLLSCEAPVAYTRGIYGWNADVFDLDGCMCLVTGYRPFGKSLPEKIVEKYEKAAMRYCESGKGRFDFWKKKAYLKKLIFKMRRDIVAWNMSERERAAR